MKRLLLILGLIMTCLPAGAADLLLGLRSPAQEEGYQYRTAWISGPKARVQIGPDLVIPQASGFVRIRVFSQDTPPPRKNPLASEEGMDDIEWLTKEDRLVVQALPEGSKLLVPGTNDPTSLIRCDGAIWRKILFAGPRYLALEEAQAGYCDGPPNPFQSSMLRVYDLESLARPVPMPVVRVLGEAAGEAFPKNAAAAFKKLSPEQHARYYAQPDPANWAIIRRHGQWVARGRLHARPETPRNDAIGFDVGTPVPGKVTQSGLPAWKLATQRIDGVQDAYLSPDGQLLVVLTRSKLLGYAPRRGFRLICQIPLRPGETPVMAVWSMPKNRSQWYAVLPRALN